MRVGMLGLLVLLLLVLLLAMLVAMTKSVDMRIWRRVVLVAILLQSGVKRPRSGHGILVLVVNCRD